MTSEVFGGSTNGNSRFVNDQTGLGPFSNGLKLDSSSDERLGKVSATGSESVGSDRNGSRGFIGFKEQECFGDGKESHELVDEEMVVAKVGCDIMFEL
jgi:hypothetical protein